MQAAWAAYKIEIEPIEDQKAALTAMKKFGKPWVRTSEDLDEDAVDEMRRALTRMNANIALKGTLVPPGGDAMSTICPGLQAGTPEGATTPASPDSPPDEFVEARSCSLITMLHEESDVMFRNKLLSILLTLPVFRSMMSTIADQESGLRWLSAYGLCYLDHGIFRARTYNCNLFSPVMMIT